MRNQPPTDREARGFWVLLGTILASSMAFIDGTAVGVALPVMQGDLDASGAQLLWIVDAYLLTLASLMLIGGSLGDRLGRKRVYIAGILTFTSASLACGLSPGTNFLIGARLVQGVGGALMIPGSLAIITAYFSRDRRGRAIGTWSAATTLCVVVGPFLGGALADAGLWRGVFLINLPVAVVALAVVVLKVPESRDPHCAPLDLIGAVLAALGLAAVTYGFISAPRAGFGSPEIYGTLAVGIILLAAFVLVERRGSHPMLPLGLFRSRVFTGANLLTLFLYGALSAAVFFLPLNLVQVQGYSALQAGLSFLPFTALLAGMSRWAGGLVDRYGPRLPLTIGPSLVGAGFLLLGVPGITSGPSDYWRTYLPGIVVFAVGMGVTVAPLTTTVMSALPERYAGTASGINNAVSRVAGVLMIAITGSIALFAFTAELGSSADRLGLGPEARQSLEQQASRLGEAEPPSEVAPDQVEAVRESIRLSFVSIFRLLTIICFCLAVLSVVMVRLLIAGAREGSDRAMPIR